MKKATLLSIGAALVVVGLCLLGATRLDNNTPHQKYFYITCVDAKGNVTYNVKSTEYPVSNALHGLGTCSYIYK